MIKHWMNVAIVVSAVGLYRVTATQVEGAELLVGGASVSITSELPVALTGQMRTRIARTVEGEVLATALARKAVADSTMSGAYRTKNWNGSGTKACLSRSNSRRAVFDWQPAHNGRESC